MTIALKEAVETQYWIRLMEESKILDSSKWKHLKALSKEVTALLVAITKTTKANLTRWQKTAAKTQQSY